MNHNKKKKINLKKNHKKLLFINICNSLIKYEIIKTTILKAKFLKKFIEPLINIAKYFNNYNIKFVYNKIKNLNNTLKLFKILSLRYLYKNGGYTSIYKVKNKIGDNSKMAIIKLK